MNRETSLYLDLVRFAASMVVLIGHLSGKRFTDGLFWKLGGFMDDAVIVFFVLSGFVIAYVLGKRESSIASFAIARAARIYSVALPALLLTFVLDALGRSQAPQLYSATWGYQDAEPLRQFVSGVFFINETWFAQIPIGSMLPYWSLSFEVWYYVLFSAVYFLRGKTRLLTTLLVCCIMGPKILILFPLWLLGYGAYVYSARRRATPLAGAVLLALSVFGYAVYHFYGREWLATHTVLPIDLAGHDLNARYLVGLLFAGHLVGFVWASTLLGGLLLRCEMAIRWFAGATFTIYLLHLPVAQFLTTVVPWSPSDWRTRCVMLLGTFFLMLLIAEFTERRKALWQRLISRIFYRIASLLPGKTADRAA